MTQLVGSDTHNFVFNCLGSLVKTDTTSARVITALGQDVEGASLPKVDPIDLEAVIECITSYLDSFSDVPESQILAMARASYHKAAFEVASEAQYRAAVAINCLLDLPLVDVEDFQGTYICRVGIKQDRVVEKGVWCELYPSQVEVQVESVDEGHTVEIVKVDLVLRKDSHVPQVNLNRDDFGHKLDHHESLFSGGVPDDELALAPPLCCPLHLREATHGVSRGALTLDFSLLCLQDIFIKLRQDCLLDDSDDV